MCGPNGLPGEVDALYRNRGDGTFEDVTRASGVYDADGKGLGVTFLDFDGDGDRDIYVANDSTPDYLFENDGTGKFTDVALVAGVSMSMYGKPQAGMGADAGDYDNDGRPDLVVANFQGDYNALRRNEGLGIFTDVSDAVGLTAPSFEKLGWGARFTDVDLDGFLDLFVTNGHVYPEVDSGGIGETYRQKNQVFLNLPDASGRRLQDVSKEVGPGLEVESSSRGVAFADVDDDQDLDVFINNMSAPPTFLVDEAEHRNHRFRILARGEPGESGRSRRERLIGGGRAEALPGTRARSGAIYRRTIEGCSWGSATPTRRRRSSSCGPRARWSSAPFVPGKTSSSRKGWAG